MLSGVRISTSHFVSRKRSDSDNQKLLPTINLQLENCLFIPVKITVILLRNNSSLSLHSVQYVTFTKYTYRIRRQFIHVHFTYKYFTAYILFQTITEFLVFSPIYITPFTFTYRDHLLLYVRVNGTCDLHQIYCWI